MSEQPMTDTEKRELACWLTDTIMGLDLELLNQNIVTWNPLESIADAHELEGCLPEHKRRIYLLRLRDFITDLEIVGMTKLYWGFRRVTPLQICLAIRKAWEE